MYHGGRLGRLGTALVVRGVFERDGDIMGDSQSTLRYSRTRSGSGSAPEDNRICAFRNNDMVHLGDYMGRRLRRRRTS
jgi:hypothetical protein